MNNNNEYTYDSGHNEKSEKQQTFVVVAMLWTEVYSVVVFPKYNGKTQKFSVFNGRFLLEVYNL